MMMLVAANSAHSNESNESFLAPLVQESLLLDIASSNNTAVVVGERGHILVSRAPDATNLESFTQVIAPVTTTLTAVATYNDIMWSVGHDATILKSSNNGETWQLMQQAPELDRPLLDVHFYDENEGLAVGAYGLFYRSIDGGESWVKEAHPSVLSDDDKDYLESIKDDEAFYLEELSYISPHFNKLSVTGDTTYLSGEAGLVAYSTDRGKSWTRYDIDYMGSFFDAIELPSQRVLAVGLRGNIFLYNNDEWQRLESCVTTTLNAIIPSDNMAYISGNNGVLLTIDYNNLDELTFGAENSEGCRTHAALQKVDSNISDAILNASINNNHIIAVTAGGLTSVRVK